MSTSLMIDIEGLATGPNATILTIAAQSFDPFGTGYYNRSFYARITLESQETRDIDQNTIDWWATQPEGAAEAFNEEGRISLQEALDGLYKLAWQHKFIWANGPTYDINILENAYTTNGRQPPWRYYQIRDTRTVYGLWPECPRPPTSHHALEDCRRQIDMLQATLQHLNIKELK